jgi:hypothetical protein
MMPETDSRRSVRFAHALYGAIIITAELVIERDHADAAGEVLIALLATGGVLLLAHTYAATIAQRTDGAFHRPREVLSLLFEESPVLISLVVPLAMFTLAGLDVIGLATAFSISIGATVAFLFLIGLVESLRIGRSVLASTLVGLLGAVIGCLVILLEAWVA